MKHNPDDRRDNVDRIQKNINHTIQNMELADEMIARTNDPKSKKDLKEKNDRRRDALNGMRAEIRDEALDKKKQV
ncbi:MULTISPECIES: small acid-soluble spore protein Tlp [unclassified Dehalobacter]|uniref:small acid-soluble spore protein Tlp n=1 Tax=unclassified Dehalobacter TaxID=2635733 RepID=UPI000E6D53C5|nr:MULTISPECIES: small acid-soluble spore protein Tlp [unclassified Dehalobacter]RJE48105.1 small acid-soluble spore protein Tlp [Dehalobacter sp. MCB1]TCX49577.1 small acid-soluble spore protein Tlp [Dehalobacter sp. 14DCB1]TCX50299.1 small acid-soluble spore protein Tlp [Dehalobacter sp. 12DCB1]